MELISLAMNRDKRLYGSALHLAAQSEYSTRVGCVAAHNSKVLAGTFNTVRNSVKNAPYGTATYHAERNCLRMVPDRLLAKLTLYIARLDKAGGHMPSKPCHRCLSEIKIRGVRELVYYNGRNIIKERLSTSD